MVLTKSQAIAAFNHIMDNILNISISNEFELKSALVSQGYDNVVSLMTIDSDFIDHFTYVNSNDTSKVVPLKYGRKHILRVWKAFYVHKTKNGNTLD